MEDYKALKLDLGCGPNKVGPDWIGVDCRKFDGVDIVFNLAEEIPPTFPTGTKSAENLWVEMHKAIKEPPKFKAWPWTDNSVDEAHSSHTVEHFNTYERIHFVNELFRILKPGATAKIIVPHWASYRAYGDLTHAWPPVSEMWFYYLKSEWRANNAPHNDTYTCNFDATWGYSLREDLMVRNQEYQMFAMGNFKEACQDTIATLTKPIK